MSVLKQYTKRQTPMVLGPSDVKIKDSAVQRFSIRKKGTLSTIIIYIIYYIYFLYYMSVVSQVRVSTLHKEGDR
jgi:hypothetical protein